MHLIVTRPSQDAEKLVTALQNQGHSAVSAPMIRIENLAAAEIPQAHWQAITVTSANSIRALSERPDLADLKSVPVLAVGPSSAQAATQAGFTSVSSADGDLEALMRLAVQNLSPSAGPVLYPSGTVISGDLKSQLEDKGFECVRVPLYEAVATRELPSELISAVQRGEMDGVVLFSPRTARIWAKCLGTAGLVQAASRLTHWCLSNAVAAALQDEIPNWRSVQNVVTAPDPNENSLLKAIGAI